MLQDTRWEAKPSLPQTSVLGPPCKAPRPESQTRQAHLVLTEHLQDPSTGQDEPEAQASASNRHLPMHLSQRLSLWPAARSV